MIRVAILTISDKGASGKRKDKSGEVIAEMIKEINGKKVFYGILPDEKEEIKEKFSFICDSDKADLVLTTGGTGFAPRDITPEATLEIVEKEVPGLPEMMRRETSKITPKAYLSRGRAGIRGTTLIINLPGNPKAVRECLQVIIDVIPHGIDILQGNVTEHE